ncbi:RHS repeat domain-containing protein [Prevotella sp. P6B4]|uniref:RHS repeat domain-containing protein n=1 Tax=Prevotella sp. P6B4 TaxID=1410614 RepID=UPI00048C8E7A|nr:RHS repeat-associated core domain-containing protein [Prevotella sp. P6B4]
MNGNLMLKTGKIEVPRDRYMAPPPSRKGDATYLSPGTHNGKELDKMHGLNTYDYGARQHDPILARWDRIDPLCEKYYNVSPYAYCNNNPAIHIDKDGKVPLVLIGALVGAAIEGGIAYSEGKSTREIIGAAAKGLIEGAVMTIPFANASAAIATSACGGGIGSCIEQYIGTGTIETKDVMESTISGAISGGASHVTSQMLSTTKNMVEKKLSRSFLQRLFKKQLRRKFKQR